MLKFGYRCAHFSCSHVRMKRPFISSVGHILHIIPFHQTEIIDLRRNLTAVIPRIILTGLLLADRGQEEHAPLELRAPRPVRHRDVSVVVRPIRGRGDALLVAELKRLHTPDDLVHVPSHARGVVEAQHQLVLRVDDEHRADGQGEVLVVGRSRVYHAVGGGDGPVLVADDGELDVDLVLAVGDHVVEPLLMRLHGVDAQRGDQAPHAFQMIVLQRESANLGGAHGREVGGVAEKDGPLSLLPLVERVEVSVRRLHGEVRDDVPEAEAAVGGSLGVERHVFFGPRFHGVHRGRVPTTRRRCRVEGGGGGHERGRG
mmetsp:Transcript_26393/g.56130  ORF Transcript_26393/g.56130 Transcript_26393/m.56130 type:complete len:315 (+) Transcript_26393:189-1133(+)